jgi:hypothetical protein
MRHSITRNKFEKELLRTIKSSYDDVDTPASNAAFAQQCHDVPEKKEKGVF